MIEESHTPSADTAAGITGMRFERARADFSDGAGVWLEEKELGAILTRRGKPKPAWRPTGEELDLDTEYNYLLIGLHWCQLDEGLVVLPGDITRENRASEEEEHYVSDYDRLVYLDRAIETLRRARAVLTMREIRQEGTEE